MSDAPGSAAALLRNGRAVAAAILEGDSKRQEATAGGDDRKCLEVPGSDNDGIWRID